MPGASLNPSPVRSSPCRRMTGLLPVHGTTPRVLILGSFPSATSLVRGEYYANPRNHFWRIASLLFSVGMDLPYERKLHALAARGIALWDVVGSCCRVGSSDDRIRKPRFNDIGGFVSQFPSLECIALNGSTAGRYFHELEICGSVRSEILPSTSPANTRYSVAQKAERWSILNRYL
ncbi:MAG TPA: DNA-deoxyinosine glycosylase [Methanoregula sp.]|nr:DNA-deoxyinosine glycosylase [Methanoregula sp.]